MFTLSENEQQKRDAERHPFFGIEGSN